MLDRYDLTHALPSTSVSRPGAGTVAAATRLAEHLARLAWQCRIPHGSGAAAAPLARLAATGA
jgi:hypothetical protein